MADTEGPLDDGLCDATSPPSSAGEVVDCLDVGNESPQAERLIENAQSDKKERNVRDRTEELVRVRE